MDLPEVLAWIMYMLRSSSPRTPFRGCTLRKDQNFRIVSCSELRTGLCAFCFIVSIPSRSHKPYGVDIMCFLHVSIFDAPSYFQRPDGRCDLTLMYSEHYYYSAGDSVFQWLSPFAVKSYSKRKAHRRFNRRFWKVIRKCRESV